MGQDLIKISASLEDYLEAIYKIIQEKHAVKAIEISKRLGVGRSSVTEALKNLADKKLVNYGRYDVISLTPAGEKLAQQVIIKHNVLYEFFADFLGVSADEAQENACKIEHLISKDAFERLIAFIEYHKQFCDNCPSINFKKFFEEKK